MQNLQLRHLVRQFSNYKAVDDFDLEIVKGELVTLLGPSGCGKTTTLRMVAGFITPDSGDIWLGGRRLTDVPPHKRNTAMVFQSYALFPHMTVTENISFGLQMRKLPSTEQKKRIGEAIEMLGLQGLESRKPGQLSGGQQQRVALARAIVTEPDVLLFDEPLSNLDAKLREKVRLEIRQLQRRLQVTTLYVTHDQAEALAISDRIVVMNQGRIEQVGAPQAIYRAPRNSFVANFLGTANIVPGEVGSDGLVHSPIGNFQLPTDKALRGNQLILSWRPEDMKITENSLANIEAARIVSLVFSGNIIEAELEIGSHRLRAHLDSYLTLREGDTLSFLIPPERLQVLEG